MDQPKHRIVTDPATGHRRLEPVPRPAELERYYQSRYYHAIRKGERAAGLERLLEPGPEAEAEREWLRHSLHGDIAETLREHAPGTRVLDVGCGTGDLVANLTAQGFAAEGIEPSEEAAQAARQRGLEVHCATLDEFARAGPRYDAISLVNVLEHVPDPAGLIATLKALLAPEGVVAIQVPNDFSHIQRVAQRRLARPPWWIAVPDHVSYFDVDSLPRFLAAHGLQTFDLQGDFPMELFLLQGDDYVGDPATGRACHARRVELERTISREDRRDLYRAWARIGLGRNVLCFARPSTPRVDMASFCREAAGYRFAGLARADIQAVGRWRNAQLDVLRQKAPLCEADQEAWFATQVGPNHQSATPDFLLVSIRDASSAETIGYGGLTNLDWEHRRGELSFLVAPERAGDPATYERDLLAFVAFARSWAFDELGLDRIFTETYAFRTHHIAVLERAGFVLEGRLRAHTRRGDEPVDSLMHGLVRTP